MLSLHLKYYCYQYHSPSASKVLLVFKILVKYHFLREIFCVRRDKARSGPQNFLKALVIIIIKLLTL